MQFRNVVVGVDFTEPSLAAVRWVARHLAPEARLVLVHVLPEPTVPPFLRPRGPSARDGVNAAAPALYGGLRGLANVIGSDRARVVTVRGTPADALALVADGVGADLVCVGRGRRRRGSARFGATTAHRLLARTRVPTVIAPATGLGMPARILAAVDARAGGEHVFDVACRLATPFEARVDALHVIEPDVEELVRTAGEGLASAGDARGRAAEGTTRRRGTPLDNGWLRDRARAWVEAMLDGAGAPVGRGAAVLGAGDPGQEVVAHALSRRADLIIIGRGGDASHSAVPAGALPIGSTARLVTWAAPCPVLVVSLDGVRGDAIDPSRGGKRRRLRDTPVIALRGSESERPGTRPPAARRCDEAPTREPEVA
jgi:nucleotide-binding universal stress UspA family protein